MLEDNDDDAGLIERALKKSNLNFTILRASDRISYVQHLQRFIPNVILSDHSLPNFNSIEALNICKKDYREVPFILVTGTVSEEFAVQCIKNGADDYILKGNLTRLPTAIANAIRQRESENEKQMAIEMLKRSEEHFRKLIENSSDIFAIIKHGRLIDYLSPSVKKILGYNPIELKQKNLFDYLHPEDHTKAEKLFSLLLNHEDLHSVEFRLMHKNNSWRYLECISKPDSIGNNTIVNIRDITERKKAEEELKAKNKELEKINRELDSFVYSASHDLRAPLKSLLGLVKLTQIELQQKTFESFDVYTGLMEKSILRLDDTIQKVIYHSSHSRLEVINQEVDFKFIVEDIQDKLLFMDGNESIEKILNIDKECPFISDLGRVVVIMNNLISNGIKYGDISKPNPYLKINITINIKEAIIVVEDNGIGIEAEFLNKVFNMFYRATEKSEGSGLGLYIVKEIVDKLNGNISVISIPDNITELPYLINEEDYRPLPVFRFSFYTIKS